MFKAATAPTFLTLFNDKVHSKAEKGHEDS